MAHEGAPYWQVCHYQDALGLPIFQGLILVDEARSLES